MDFEDDYNMDSEQDSCVRDTFYALTDGMYGDYEDWIEDGNDYDSLRDMIGY